MHLFRGCQLVEEKLLYIKIKLSNYGYTEKERQPERCCW